MLLVFLTWAFHSLAQAQPCSEELRILQEQRQQMRSALVSGNPGVALDIASKMNLEPPPNYDYEESTVCQKWALEVAYARRGSCAFESARLGLRSIETEQALAYDGVQKALERLSYSSNIPFTCKDKQGLTLVCEPVSTTDPDAWCARRIEADNRLEVPRGAWCKLIDDHGVEISSVSEGTEPSCREDVAERERTEALRVRAERRATVAGAGTGIAVLAAVAVPLTFLSQGTVKLFRRIGIIDEHSVERMNHRSFRARQRVLPLLGVTALSVSSLSSRFWWAGVLAAGCGVTGDVMLAQHWHRHQPTKRAVGIATATLGAAAGLILNIETLDRSDMSMRYALMPTVSVGVAQAELGFAGRF